MSVMIAQTTGYVINNTNIPVIIQDHGKVRTAHVDLDNVDGVFLIGWFNEVEWLYMVKKNNQYIPFYMINDRIPTGMIISDKDIIITYLYVEDMTPTMYAEYNEIINAVRKIIHLKK